MMIDQRALPLAERYVTCTDYRQVIAAIKDLTVRGAPAIGVAAAMGIALGARSIEASTPAAFRDAFEEICRQFGASAPDGPEPLLGDRADAALCEAALDAADRFRGIAGGDPFGRLRERLVAEAIRIGEEDIATNRRLGRARLRR